MGRPKPTRQKKSGSNLDTSSISKEFLPQKSRKTLTVRLSDKLTRAATVYSEELGIPLSSLLSIALADYLRDKGAL